AEKTASEVSFGVVTNKAITIAPRFVLQGQTAGLQKNYYPDPKAYEVDASQIGQATSFSFKTPDTLPAGTYTVIFDVKAEDGTTKRLSTTMTIAPKPKTVEVASVRKTGSSPYIGDRLSVWVTMEKEAPEDTSVDVVVGNAKASGVVKKGQKESEEIKVWGPGQARSAAGGGEHVIQATPKGGKTFNGPSVSVPGGGGGAPGPKGPRKPAGQ
ncbi:MAG TPA: hypothetical protein VLJ37_12260, partial [bacterium]|nr:hypothetical protein [bacterium]